MVTGQKIEKLQRFASSFLMACQARGLDADDIAHVLGFVAEVTSASRVVEGGVNAIETSEVQIRKQAEQTRLMIAQINDYADRYRAIRHGHERQLDASALN